MERIQKKSKITKHDRKFKNNMKLVEINWRQNLEALSNSTPLLSYVLRRVPTDKTKENDFSRAAKYLITNLEEDLNEEDKTGRTPLFYAVERGNIKFVRMLLDYGADINQINTKGEPETHGLFGTANILVRGDNILHFAIKQPFPSEPIIRLLYDNGAYMFYKNKETNESPIESLKECLVLEDKNTDQSKHRRKVCENILNMLTGKYLSMVLQKKEVPKFVSAPFKKEYKLQGGSRKKRRCRKTYKCPDCGRVFYKQK